MPFWSRFNVRGLILAAIFMAIFFASILAHELAHAIVGTRYRVPIARIDINMLGGLVHFLSLPYSRRQDFLITSAGPLSNLAIGVAAIVMVLPVMPPAPSDIVVGGKIVGARIPKPNMLAELLRATAYLNIGLCVVNLLPGVPLDGGKLVYLLVERRWNARAAMLTVSSLGMVFSFFTFLLMLGSLLVGCPIWAPPALATNLEAFRAARKGRTSWDAVAR